MRATDQRRKSAAASLRAIQLLHPDGMPHRVLHPGSPDPGGELDVAIIEDASPATADLLRNRLARDGIAYLRGPARTRREVARAAGLRLSPAVLELNRLLVPLQRDAVRFALDTRTASPRAWVAARAPANSALLSLVAPAAVARRQGARPLGAWLRQRVNGTAILAAPTAGFVVRADGLAAVAKVGRGPAARREFDERDALALLGPIARAAGADVPEPLDAFELDGSPVLVETGVRGRVAATALVRRGSLLDDVFDRLATWLSRWNAATAAPAIVDVALVERELLEPAQRLSLPGSYRAWLEQRSTDAAGATVPLVAAHNDLTSGNVLLGRAGRLGIVDWDTAERATLPLTDLFYAVADFQAASQGFGDRTEAFVSCFASDGIAAERAARHERRLAQALGVSPAIADLCFHACWLRHAANEALRPEANERAFQTILQVVLERRIRMDP